MGYWSAAVQNFGNVYGRNFQADIFRADSNMI